MEYYAKSDPKQTIQEHTDLLLENFQLLRKVYPDLQVNWDLLYYAALHHDIGKGNRIFQWKIRNKDERKTILSHQERLREIPHAFLSVTTLPIKELKAKFENTAMGEDAGIYILVNSIVFHHDRIFDPDNYDEDQEAFRRKIQEFAEDIKDFTYEKINLPEKLKFPRRFFKINGLGKDFLEQKYKSSPHYNEICKQSIMVKGMLHRLDYAASSGEPIELEKGFLERSLEDYMAKKMKEDPKLWTGWNDLQKYMIRNREHNVIAIAQTGRGKTEAGLLWIGDNKGFFTLPIRVAINDIYDRIRKSIVIEQLEDRVGLLHGNAFGEYITRFDQSKTGDKAKDNDHKNEGLSRYHGRTRLLSMPLTLSTLDQLFTFVFKYRGYEHKLATLAYSKIVIDEIQMYSPDLLAYLIYGLWDIVQLGGRFAIITATFPPMLQHLLNQQGVVFEKPAVFIDEDDKIRHRVRIVEDTIQATDIVEKYLDHRKVLVICNTVATAQELYQSTLQLMEENGIHKTEKVNLIHSYYIQNDKKHKERDILELGRTANEEDGIWIGTQVLEASLDIDFDVLLTELSDINGFLQRLGRVHRKYRPSDAQSINAYLYIGKSEKKSGIRGVGTIIDKDIFEKSKEEIKKVQGELSEAKKLEIINKVYSVENLKQTDYYKTILRTMEYLDHTFDNELSKSEADKAFRDIVSINVIPRPVFEENKERILELMDRLKYKKGDIATALEKAKIRNELAGYQVSLNHLRYRKYQAVPIEINDYETAIIYDCKYDKEFGFSNVDEKSKGEEDNSREIEKVW